MDHSKHILGNLCRRGHESTAGSGKLWRYVVKGRLRDERMAERRKTAAGKSQIRVWNAAYVATPEGRARKETFSRRYRNSVKGRATRSRHNRRYKSENREHLNRLRRERYASDEVFALTMRLRIRLWEAFKTYSTRGKTRHSDEYGIDYQAIIDHVGPCPGPRDEWHLDHVRPLVSFDWDDPTTPARAFAPENHQWLPREKNLSKGSTRDSTEF